MPNTLKQAETNLGLDMIIQQGISREMETIKLTLCSHKKEMSNTTLICSTLLTYGESWSKKRDKIKILTS